MGLLDNIGQSFGNMTNDPRQMGLLMAAAQMMAQSGPSNRPVGLGEIMGGGMSTFLNTRNSMQQQQADASEREQAQQYRGVQMQGLQQQQEKIRADLMKAKELEDHFKKFRAGGQAHPMAASAQGQGLTMGYAEGAEAPQTSAMPTLMQGQPQMGQPGPQESPYQRHMAMAAHMRDGGYEEKAIEYENQAVKFMPEVQRWQPVRVGDSIMLKPYFKDGSSGAPVDTAIAEKLEWRDSGGSYEGRDAYTGKTVTTQRKTQTPDSVATATTAANRLKFDKDQAAAPIFNADAGVFVNRPTAQNPSGSVTPIEGFNRAGKVVAEQEAKRVSASKALLPILDQAEKLVDGATGSYAGAGVDQLARVFGKSTDGAKVTAQLKVLEGQIMMSQPRMEGPQSNMDVALYRQMAGQIGDPTTPIETRKAAIQGIRALHQRYAGQGGASGDWDDAPAADPRPTKPRRYNPATGRIE